MREGGTDSGNIDGTGCEGSDDQVFTHRRIALVEDDDGHRAGSFGIECFGRKRACASLDQRNVSGREAVKICCSAAAGAGARRHKIDVDPGDYGSHTAVAGAGEGAGVVGGRKRRDLIQGRQGHIDKGEGIECHVVTRGGHFPDHVADALFITLRPGGAHAAVGVGDVLQRDLVPAHSLKRHTLEQF